MTLGSLSREMRLLIRLAVSNANQCRYCTAHQKHQLIGLGVAAPKIAAVAHTESDGLSPRERAAVRFAQAITIDAGDIQAEVAAEFVELFTRGQRNGHAEQDQRFIARAARVGIRTAGKLTAGGVAGNRPEIESSFRRRPGSMSQPAHARMNGFQPSPG